MRGRARVANHMTVSGGAGDLIGTILRCNPLARPYPNTISRCVRTNLKFVVIVGVIDSFRFYRIARMSFRRFLLCNRGIVAHRARRRRLAASDSVFVASVGQEGSDWPSIPAGSIDPASNSGSAGEVTTTSIFKSLSERALVGTGGASL